MPWRHASVDEIGTALDALDLLPEERTTLVDKVQQGTLGLLLYGSRARGDFLPESDFDLLRYSDAPDHTFKVGRVSVSTYAPKQLESASRTLFGTHLARDGRVLLDTDGELASAISQLEPASPEQLLQTVRRYSVILNTSQRDRECHLSGLVRLARYLTRTAIYSRAMATGTPCFSVRELAERFDDSSLAVLLASDPEITGPPTLATLGDLETRLIDVIGPLSENPYGSIERLAVEMWDVDRNIAALAVRAASEDTETLDYSDLPKVLL